MIKRQRVNRANTRTFWPWLAVSVWMVLIFILSSIPGESLLDIDIPNIDKLVHFLEFFILSILLIRAFRNSFDSLSIEKIATLSLMISILYAIMDETRQHFISDRTPDILDILADFTGSYIGVVIYRRIKRWRR